MTRANRVVPWVVAASLLGVAAPAQDGPGTRPAEVEAGYGDAIEAFARRADSRPVGANLGPQVYPDAAWVPRLLATAKASPDDPGALAALICVLKRDPDADSGREALALLAKDHLGKSGVAEALPLAARSLAASHEQFLRAALDRGGHDEVRGLAAWHLARSLKHLAARARSLADETDPDQIDAIEAANGPVLTARLRAVDPAKTDCDIESLLVRARELLAGTPSGKRLATELDGAIREAKTLSIGKVAPEIEGKDLRGEPLLLSNFRGKVVVLVFWNRLGGGSADLSTYQRLMRRFEERPVAVVGVDCGESREAAPYALECNGVSWPCFWNGGSGKAGIAKDWNVRAWPAIYVLDQNGIIRFKDRRGRALHDAVDSLLRKMKAEGPKEETR